MPSFWSRPSNHSRPIADLREMRELTRQAPESRRSIKVQHFGILICSDTDYANYSFPWPASVCYIKS